LLVCKQARYQNGFLGRAKGICACNTGEK
jgi:hypothetical protein